MCLQGIVKRSRGDPNGRKGCVLGHRDMPGEFLASSYWQFSSRFAVKVQERNGDNRRRSEGMDGGENRFLGGSDPTLSGMEAAQRHGRRGSLPPNLFSTVPRSVAGRVADRKPNQFEFLTAEEMKRWP